MTDKCHECNDTGWVRLTISYYPVTKACPRGCKPPEPDHEAALCAAIERNLVTPPAAPERRCSLCCTAIIDMQEATQQTGGAWHHDRMTMCIANLQSEHSALRAKVERLDGERDEWKDKCLHREIAATLKRTRIREGLEGLVKVTLTDRPDDVLVVLSLAIKVVDDE